MLPARQFLEVSWYTQAHGSPAMAQSCIQLKLYDYRNHNSTPQIVDDLCIQNTDKISQVYIRSVFLAYLKPEVTKVWRSNNRGYVPSSSGVVISLSNIAHKAFIYRKPQNVRSKMWSFALIDL